MPLNNPPDTRILDGTIAALTDNGTARRAPRRAQVELIVTVDRVIRATHEDSPFQYTITSNGRTLEQGDGNAEFAVKRAGDRAAAIRALGKTVKVTVFS